MLAMLAGFVVLGAIGISIWVTALNQDPVYSDAGQRWLPMDGAVSVQRQDGSYTPDASVMVVNREDYEATYVEVELTADTVGRLKSWWFDVRLRFDDGSERVCQFRDSHLFSSGPLTETAYCEFRLAADEMAALDRATFVPIEP